ncbi:uncharacterized protein LOC130666909 [Microplitis mediator]|uniref:uncharacterized protein LOC130666909 n=1 Tax=Microplitis mediator TaxID=375433 RepID=UPI00255725E8|nr:uncharacterized protein LOC130666909 [Microplitis mediator]
MAAAPYRISALRVACAFRTVSTDAINVLAGMVPIELLAKERRSLYQQKSAEARIEVLSGHGCFRKYLHKFNYEDATDCPTCLGVDEDAEHTFFECPRFSATRSTVEKELNIRLTPENLVEQILSSEAAWKAISAFAAVVMKELRRRERERKKMTPEQQTAQEIARNANP